MADLDGLRSQVQLHNYIALRDLPKRFATVQFLIFCVWWAGFPGLAVANLLWLVAVEAVILWLIRTTPEVAEISPRRVRALLTCSSLVTFGYYAPGLILALQPDFGLAMGGLAWILGALSTNLVMYNALRAFYWSTAIVSLPTALAAVLLSFDKDVAPAAGHTWLLPVAIVCLYIVNTLQQLREYRDTHCELATTRAELLDSFRKLKHMSLHDGLTALQNRVAFNEALRRMLARASAHQQVGVLMIDLNGFKPINDTYGHEAGDAVLIAVAYRLKEALRPGAEAFRLGGDEFAVLSTGQTEADFQALGDRLIMDIRQPILFEDKMLTLGASVGIATSDRPDLKPDVLVSQADQAMYLAKSAGAATALRFDPDQMEEKATEARRGELEDALRAGDIFPYYQPRYTIDGCTRVGFQALARWVHPWNGVQLPETFLGDMTELGLLPDLTHAILRQVLRDLADWRQAGLDPGRVSVNVPLVVFATESGREELDWLLAQHPGSEPFLAFEITEDVYVARSGDIIAASIRHFRAQGIEIHLDDFGTGQASYQHLRHLTPDVLKIDGSLVSEMGTEAPAEVVIAGFILIAAGIGARVVAEHVETETQRSNLAALGCDYVEGHIFAPAMPVDDAAELMRAPIISATGS